MEMNVFKKGMFKILLPFIVGFLVNLAEKYYEEAKSGDKKKAYVVDMVEYFCKLYGFDEYLNFDKLGKLIEEKVMEFINKA
jgi:hypothetical protein